MTKNFLPYKMVRKVEKFVMRSPRNKSPDFGWLTFFPYMMKVLKLNCLTKFHSFEENLSVSHIFCWWLSNKIARKYIFKVGNCLDLSKNIKITDLPLETLFKKRLWHRCFPVNFAKFRRASFLTEHIWWFLL